MNRKSLVGIAALLLLVIAAAPVTAVKFENVSVTLETYQPYYQFERSQPGVSPEGCVLNDTYVNITVKFDINTTFPKTYIIGFYSQILSGSTFDFSNASVTVLRNTVDITSNVSIYTAEPGTLELSVSEGPGEFTSLQSFEIRIYGVKTPSVAGNYSFAMGLYDITKNVQYGESAVTLRVCERVPPPAVPGPMVVPCGNCSYKYDRDSNTLMRAVPEACFQLRAPYKEGFEFKGFKMFVDNPLTPAEVMTEVKEHPSDVCAESETQNVPAVNVDLDFTNGSYGWLPEGDWEWGQPVDLIDVCEEALYRKAWGLKLNANYSAGEAVFNLTSPELGTCNFNGTVTVSFTYSAYLEDGDKVIVEGWNGTDWVEITKITSSTGPLSVCMETFNGNFTMNTSGEWKTKIRFRFVGDGDANTSYGFYVFDITVTSEDTCPVEECARYVPDYYYTECLCLGNYTTTELNDEHVVWTEALYYESGTGRIVKSVSDNFTIMIDNTGPEIERSGEDDSNFYFNVTDNLVGVDANADDEPIKVVAGEERFFFEHWEKDYNTSSGGQIYTYHVYDPANETKSAAIFFDRIELGLSEALEVYGGCMDCLIFGTGIGEGCYESWYLNWSANVSRPECTHSAWVRVPLQACELSCNSTCDGCYPQEGCEDCAYILYYDSGEAVEWGIHIDSIVYGTGIKVFLDGKDITDQVTITSSGRNVTIAVPKDLVTNTSELVIYATDKVGNANKATFQLSVSGEITGPSEEPWQAYDANDDGNIQDEELIAAINDWLNGVISDGVLIDVIMKWLE